MLIKIYNLPPHVWDVFAYHLHPVAEWAQQNVITPFIDSPVSRINRNPLGSKLLHYWCFQFSGDIRWIELPQFIFGLLVTLTSYSIMLKINIKKHTALRYAVLIYFIPLILIGSRTCQDHLVLNSTILIAMLYFINVFFQKKSHQLVFLSLSFGLLLGMKISSLQIIFVFFLALLICKGFNRSQILEFLNKNRWRIGSGLLIIFTLGGYWFLKNNLALRSYSNMFFKVVTWGFLLKTILLILATFLLAKGFKKIRASKFLKKNKQRRRKIVFTGIIIISILAGYGVIKNIGLVNLFVFTYESPAPLLSNPSLYTEYPVLKVFPGKLIKNLLVFPFRIKDVGFYTPYTPDFLQKSGFGIQFFVFGLIAYIIMILSWLIKKKYRNSIVGLTFIFSMVLLATYFIYYYTWANYRMFMFFPVFGIILWAFFQGKLNFQKYYRKYVDVLIVAMILFNISACFYEGNTDIYRWKTLLTINNHLDQTSIKYSPFFKGNDWGFIDKYIQPEEPIGYLGHYDSWVFPYFDNRLKRRIYHLRSLPGFKLVSIKSKIKKLVFSPLFKESLKQRHIHFIHINPQGVRHRENKGKSILIDDKSVCPVSENLYYFDW